MSNNSGSLKSIFLALGANFVIAVSKYIVAFITNSGSMMAEAVHSTADCANQGLLLLGIKQSKRPPGPEYPLGSGKETYFWSFLVALLLFSVGGIFSIYEGIHKLHEGTMLQSPAAAIGVLVFAILAEGYSLRGCYKEIVKIKGNRPLKEWLKNSRRSELIVVFGEDVAAELGLFIALIAVIAAVVTKNPMYDALGSISIGVLLIIVAIFLGIKVKSLLIGQGVDPVRREEYIQFIDSSPEVDQLFNLITLQMGGDVMIAVKAKMTNQNSADEMIKSINKVEVEIKQKFSEIKWSFFEPDNVQ